MFTWSLNVISSKLIDFKALLSANYDDIEFRYIVYDTKAYEFSEEQLFGRHPKFLGGGTSNLVGYEKAEKVLQEYNYEEWNKFVIGIGDAGAHDGPATVEVLERIYPQLQYLAFVYADNGWWGDEQFIASMQDLASRKQWVGYAHLQKSDQKSIISALRSLFPRR